MSNRNFLRFIVFASLIAVVSLSCFSIFFIAPSFTKQIIKNTESEAEKVGRHLSRSFYGMDKITRDLPSGFVEIASWALVDFGLMKIKVFAPDGETVYSTSEKDIGQINERVYFHNIVAKGNVFTKLVKKDTQSLEGQVVRMDVVETYVPIMHGGKFAGAYEIYFDITDNMNDLDSLHFKTNSLLLLIAAGLMLAVMIISFIARRSFFQQEQAEKEILRQSQHLQDKNSELSVFNDVAKALSGSLELKDLLPLLLETLINRLPVLNLENKGGIMLVDGEKMVLAAHLGHDDTFMELHKDISINDCLCGLAVRTGEIVISPNSHADSRHTICYGGMRPHGHIILPLKSAQKVVGVLYLYLPVDTELGEFKRNLLESIAVQVGMAIDNARLYAETKQKSLHDHLTGLANRRLMDISLQKAITQADRYDRHLCVAMMDIDFFKKYNDTKGHDAGDRLLVEIADIIAKNCRQSDLAARYGGEEFLLIMPESDISKAHLAAERIREIIEITLNVTISAGVAMYKKGSSSAELIKAADMALYKAKGNGRNRVESA